MLRAEIESFLSEGLDRMGLSRVVKPEVLPQLAVYFQELKKWNRKVNLVARSLDDRDILEKHFLDSLTLLLMLRHEELETVLDIGTGAGFPGLVLKAACPALSVTLIEPRKNRYYFLKHIARTLNLKGVEMLCVHLAENVTLEELTNRRFSFITSRAFSDSFRFIALADPYLEKKGRILLMKGPAALTELNELEHNDMNGKFFVAETRQLYLPYSNGERWLVSVKRFADKG